MEEKACNVFHKYRKSINVRVIPGHFSLKSNPNTHCSHYLDFSKLKSSAASARDVARELVMPYRYKSPVDTIVCMENTKVIGAYMALEFLQNDEMGLNNKTDIHIITPMRNTQGNLTFYESELEWVKGQNIILLTAMISTGMVVGTVLECLSYYGGKIAGISTLFEDEDNTMKYDIYALFTSKDIHGYKHYKDGNCELCRTGQPLEAIVSSEGYTKLQPTNT